MLTLPVRMSHFTFASVGVSWPHLYFEKRVDPLFYISGLWFHHDSKPSYLATHSTHFLFRGCAAQTCRHVHAEFLDIASVRLPDGGAPPGSALRQMPSAHHDAEISFPMPEHLGRSSCSLQPPANHELLRTRHKTLL